MAAMPTTEIIVPYRANSPVVISRVAKAIAFGGVLIGRLIAREHAKATAKEPTTGDSTANEDTRGIIRFAVAVLLISLSTAGETLRFDSGNRVHKLIVSDDFFFECADVRDEMPEMDYVFR